MPPPVMEGARRFFCALYMEYLYISIILSKQQAARIIATRAALFRKRL